MTLLSALCLPLLLASAAPHVGTHADSTTATPTTLWATETSPPADVLSDSLSTDAGGPEATSTSPASDSLVFRPLGLRARATTAPPAVFNPAVLGDASVFADTTVSPLDTLRMSRWERVFWGRHGLARVTGLFPTHPDKPVDDLRQIATTRRKMLGLHQTLGLVTVASMAATVVGGQIAINTGNSGFHKATLPVTIGLYSTTAALALLSPPKLVRYEGGGIDSITIHRWLAVGHLAGMALTPLLAPDGADDARVHQVSGYLTFGTFSAAMLVVTLLRR